jgi:hypothetical protein
MIARKAVLALLALMLLLPAGTAAADRFKYRYKVATVDLYGKFHSNYDDGTGHKMTAYEQIWVHGEGPGAPHEQRARCGLDNKCDFFVKSNFTLRNPVSPSFAPNGMLTTSPFKRFYDIRATETRADKPPVDCSRKVEDEDRFGGSMWLTKRKTVRTFWSLPAVAVRCDLNGGEASADPIDRTSEDGPLQFTERYPLGLFRKHKRVVMNVEIDHEWQPDDYTNNTIRWTGWVIAKRVR